MPCKKRRHPIAKRAKSVFVSDGATAVSSVERSFMLVAAIEGFEPKAKLFRSAAKVRLRVRKMAEMPG